MSSNEAYIVRSVTSTVLAGRMGSVTTERMGFKASPMDIMRVALGPNRTRSSPEGGRWAEIDAAAKYLIERVAEWTLRPDLVYPRTACLWRLAYHRSWAQFSRLSKREVAEVRRGVAAFVRRDGWRALSETVYGLAPETLAIGKGVLSAIDAHRALVWLDASTTDEVRKDAQAYLLWCGAVMRGDDVDRRSVNEVEGGM